MAKILKQTLKKIKQLTLLDWVLAILFFGGLGFFILYFQRSDEFITVRFKVTDPNTFYIATQAPNEFAYQFFEGDIELNEIGQMVAEIEDVTTYQVDPNRQIVYLDIKVKANYNPIKKQYSLKGRPIIFGQSFLFNFSKVKVEATAINIPELTSVRPTKKLIVETQMRDANRQFSDTYGVPSFIAEAVAVGDEIKDKQGQVIVKVTDKRVVPAKRTVISSQNVAVVINDPDLKDIFLTLEIVAQEIDGHYFVYDFSPILVGKEIPLQFPDINLWPTIISFKEV